MASSKACLLLHGFTGGPYEVQPLAKELMLHGYAVRTPRLPGHDERLVGLRTVHRREWLDAVMKEGRRLEQQYGTFDLVGFSMGGLLAAYAANRLRVRRLVLLGTPIVYVSPTRFVRAAVERWRGASFSKLPVKERTPAHAVVQFLRLAKELRPQLSRIRQPVLVVQGKTDPIVHPISGRLLYHWLPGDKELLYLPRSGHLLCLDQEAELLFHQVKVFLDQPEGDGVGSTQSVPPEFEAAEKEESARGCWEERAEEDGGIL
ncbi:carboxylesterase [Paenibacillus sp. J31TS4]|uniref:alpha/beta hydrolase n=1 Tax=Paenibacillus sp. J31TS4 TaxID=2807195 RepID=UPI001B26C563|nr:alpha/beta fold hydrolase [Paenibacillus sp. J31TS4]GIP37331.1 carboxylesterase [Paenibacillus sp. J31TS4]